jgi:hypothetical protein
LTDVCCCFVSGNLKGVFSMRKNWLINQRTNEKGRQVF